MGAPHRARAAFRVAQGQVGTGDDGDQGGSGELVR